MIVVGAGMVAAMNYGKLPPAMDPLQAELGIGVVGAAWLVTLFSLASATLGVAGGALGDRFGARRTMISGLLLVAVASAAGALASTPFALSASRAVESVGFMMAVLPGPALLRDRVPASRVPVVMGIWATYMPAGMSMALLLSPAGIALGGWRLLWWAATALALLAAVFIYVDGRWPGLRSGGERRERSAVSGHSAPAGLSVPAAPSARAGSPAAAASSSVRAESSTAATESSTEARTAGNQRAPLAARRGFFANLRVAVSSPAPWLLALCFASYTGQFVGVFSFLPMVLGEAGFTPVQAAAITALGVFANVTGSFGAGVLLARGVPVQRIIGFTGVTMALCAWVIFAAPLGAGARIAAVFVFSGVGGFIPGAVFACAPRLAPDPAAVTSTVGMVQQGSGLGQLVLPMVMALVAQAWGDWSVAWIVTAISAAGSIVLGLALGRFDARVRARAPRATGIGDA